MGRKAIPVYVKNEVFLKQDKCCGICFDKLITTEDGIDLWDCDHIVNHSETQDNSIENLQMLCLNCHRIKTVHDMRHKASKRKVVKEYLEETKISIEGLPNPFDKYKLK